MRQFPAFFNLSGQRVVIVGSGEEALRKLRLFVSAGALPVIISDHAGPAHDHAVASKATAMTMDDLPTALETARLAIVAEDNPDAIAAIRAARVPLNVVDRPELCDFTVPSILDRGDIVAAIGSNGTAPVLAKSIRTKLEALLPARIGDLAALAGRLRETVKAALPDFSARRKFWERTLTGRAAELAYAGDLTGAEAAMRAELFAPTGQGVVHIVGAGPGDPELLTLKALRLIQEADIVYYDRLVSDGILSLIRRDADRVSVGKAKGNHSVPQGQIHELLIASAREGKRVVRLKGGDPFVFGRGGEELDAVEAAGVEAFVVPGISSALGCAASAGIPLTHRDHAQAVTFVTGHAKAGGVPDLDWPSLAKRGQTVSVYMGVGTAGTIAEKLIEAGRAPQTPVAVIENGTRENEVRAYGMLEELPQLIEAHGIKGPALLIIGEVAGLRAGPVTTRVSIEEPAPAKEVTSA
ncbi:siroheme synthase [Hyphomonas adhaerens MHS-3]|uniref:Siroheme synthase n=1 Tax=Hyphomonas adhaerens MHS-3 TaxID=1280949 RepID=A0A069E542_9PROT|nr:siroheme synthase CysG [Hyphomonas adhaerens]KCZ85410.1 siroheme synthase [Hyphomonas adhaerens MHS-3]